MGSNGRLNLCLRLPSHRKMLRKYLIIGIIIIFNYIRIKGRFRGSREWPLGLEFLGRPSLGVGCRLEKGVEGF
jgi:hypothetical protein